MSRAVERLRGLRWKPDELGQSVPIARGMWMSRLAGLGLGLAGVAVVALMSGLRDPEVDELSETETRRLVVDRLAQVELEPWEPGRKLPSTDLPPFLEAPPPELWDGRHPGDPEADDATRLEQAEGLLRQGASDPSLYLQASTLYQRAARANPRSWSIHYNAAISLLRGGFHREAADYLDQALDLLSAHEGRHGETTEHRAAEIASRYAAALAVVESDCVRAVRHLKRAVRGLRLYVENEPLEVFDRRLPFQVEPTRIDNYDVWNTLAGTYLKCEGRYPEEYFRRWADAKTFVEGEYADADAPEVRDGPFPKELTECIADNGSSARCWAVSNLNRVYYASRSLFPDAGQEPPRAFRALLPSLARLGYNVAHLAARGPDKAGAVAYLQKAARLDRASTDELREPIADLGRHLAPVTKNYAILAEPYIGRSVAELPFDEASSLEEVKGMAWALSAGRWQGFVTKGRPDRVMDEVDEAARQVPGEYLSSLRAWKADVQEQLRDALADGIRLERRRGNLANALALRDFRADYLGEDWPSRARGAWRSFGVLAASWALALLFLALLAGWWLLHRYVVYPYLLYTTDYYRTEFRLRAEERRKAGNKPFTGRDIRRWLEGNRLGRPVQPVGDSSQPSGR